jgi:ABC-type glutathione transport system ATPase component
VTTDQPVIEVSGLTVRYATKDGPVIAVQDVSFTLRRGGALAVVGESGAGKSTVVRLVAGLEHPTEGTVLVRGAAPAARARGLTNRLRRAAAVQLVHQDPHSSLDPHQTIGRGLDELLRLHSVRLPGDLGDPARRRERVRELLSQVSLDPAHADARPARLSGGQRQRAAIARALAVQPEVLLLDEAVAALDVSVQAQILNLLADIREQTATALLFVTHDLSMARQLCEQAVVMRAGRIVESGPVSRLLTAPEHPYTRALLDSVPRPGWRPRRTHPVA